MQLSYISRILFLVKVLFRISIIKFLYYNFLCRKVKRHGKGYIIPYKNAIIALGDNSLIELYEGHFSINHHKPSHSNAEAYVKLLSGARLAVHGSTILNYLSTIEIHKDAVVEIGSAYINSGAVILAAKRICIGKEVLISRHVFIYDSDHHPIYNENKEVANPARDVVIGSHVWIGLKCIILRGSNIGDGAVIAAGSVVGGKIKEGVMAQGNPARGYSSITWGTTTEQK